MKRDVVERAKDSLNAYDYAHAYGCDSAYPAVLIRDLVSEVERLRAALADVCIDQYIRENGLAGIKTEE